jgi:transcriptional regulator with XRE-family HTH domain
MNIAAQFAENVKHYRDLAGISQEQLATMASLHRTEISQVERGLRLARIDTLVKLAASLGQTPNDLLTGIHWTPGITQYGSFGSGVGVGDERLVRQNANDEKAD